LRIEQREDPMWTVQEAKAKLSHVLQRAREGEPQVIGAQEPCVVISLTEYRRLTERDEEPHLGRWLVENAPRVGDLELPPRDRERLSPGVDFSEEEEKAG
jgi:prevent-host-death family protein